MKQVWQVLVLGSVLFLSGCVQFDEYEDGPWITFGKAEKKIVNSWAYSVVKRNGLNVTCGSVTGSIDYCNSIIGFNDHHRFSTVITSLTDTSTMSIQLDGDWELFDNAEKIRFLFDDALIPSIEWRITRLQDKKFWAEEDIDGQIFEYQLIPN